jgi:hypothetical protein
VDLLNRDPFQTGAATGQANEGAVLQRLTCLLGALLFAGCSNGTVATVNSQSIARAEFEARLRSSPMAIPILRLMAQEMLVEQYAQKNGISVNASEIDALEEQMKARFPGNAWHEMLASRQLTETDARAFLRDRLVLEKAVSPSVNVPPAQVEAYFEKNRSSFGPAATVASATPQIRAMLGQQQVAAMANSLVQQLVESAKVASGDPRFERIFSPPNAPASNPAAEATLPLTLNPNLLNSATQ